MIATSPHPMRAAVTAAAMSVTALLTPWGAGAQEVADATKKLSVLEQPATADFTKEQCVTILSKASEIFGAIGLTDPDGQRTYNPELPLTLAKYLAPNDTEFVRGFLVNGSFAQIANSKKPSDLPIQQRLVAALACNGPKLIVTSGRGIATWNTIRVTLYQESGINLDRAGVRGVLPEVVGSLPGPSTPKAELRTSGEPRVKLRLN